LLLAATVSIGTLIWRTKGVPKSETTTEDIQSREFGFTMAVIVLTLCGFIAALGLSAPLLTGLGVKLHMADFQGAVREDYHNKALFPIAVLLALGMGIGPHLAWRGKGGLNGARLVWSYALSVVAALGFVLASKYLGTPLKGQMMIPQLLLFTASVFAVISNLTLLRRLFPGKEGIKASSPWTIGGVFSHVGAAVLLIGVVCLVTFVKKDPDVTLVQNKPVQVLDADYTMTYQGQTGDWQADRDNKLKFAVVSRDGKEKFMALLPYALRPVEGGEKKIFGHPSIVHHAGGDLYFALKDGPDEFYNTPVYQPKMKLGDVKQVNLGTPLNPKIYTVEFMRFDNPMGAIVRQTGQMPDVFPVAAVLRVTYEGITTLVKPQFIRYKDSPLPKSPELKLPGGALIGFAGMNAGSVSQADPGAGAMSEMASLTLRADSGPPHEAFQLDITTRPMINLVWVGTLLLVFGGLISMRRRIQENRLIPIPDLEVSAPPDIKVVRRVKNKNRIPTAKPAPSLSVVKPRRN
jgi:cytochrome c-type biogenesis protein CcmF